MKAILTVKQVSAEFGFPEFGLRTLIKAGKIPVIKCGNRCYIARAAFEAFLKTGGEHLHSDVR